ncbi:MAG: beta-ketoacyl-ACP synthase II [Candidatus Omnitrophica bacterium]|nr:beta-ketoacyl-ACP synthase II [Candidatus Omnitrophota bacterium]
MTKKRVVVTGIGVLSPVGNGVEAFWQGLKSGKSGVAPITRFDAALFDTKFAAELKGYNAEAYFNPKDARKISPFVQYGIVAAREAMANANFKMNEVDAERVGVVVGSGIGAIGAAEEEYVRFLEKGPTRISPFFITKMIINEVAGHISIDIGAKGPITCSVTACATGTTCIGDAFKMIQYGEIDAAFAGGSEAAISVLGVGGFCALKALSTRNDAPEQASRPFDKDRDGFVMGEGAAVLVLEELEYAKKRGANILAELVGYGQTGDAFHSTAPDDSGEGAARAMVQAVGWGGLKMHEVDYINAHGTSTYLNDKIESLAIRKAFGDHAGKLAVSSTKSMTGHLLGAAGAVECAACVLAIRDQIIPPTINYTTPDPDCSLDYVPNQARQAKVDLAISNSLGFGGHNATIAIKKFQE